MTDIDTRVLTLIIWGVGTVAIYGIVLAQRFMAYRHHRDPRSRRELLEGFALFLVALGAASAIGFVLFGDAGDTPRGIATAIALGAFTGAGWVMASEGTGEKLGR